MSTTPEPTKVNGTNPDPANSEKTADSSEFGILGSLPTSGVNESNGNSTEPMTVDKKEDAVAPPDNTKPACKPAITEDPKPLIQSTNLDKVTPGTDTKSASGAANTAPFDPVVSTKEAKTNTPASTKSVVQATITEKSEPLLESATVEKVKPTLVETKPAEKPETIKATEMEKSTENSKVTEVDSESKKSAETSELVVKSDDKTKTPEAGGDKSKSDDKGAHSLGGESANQFTPPLPEDFLKKAQANVDASKHYVETSNVSKIASRVNSQIPSSRPLENKTDDLLVAPIIPRPKKRPAAKSLLKQLGQSHVTNPLKKVKSVKAKTEKQPPGRGKSPGRGRATQSKSPAQKGPSVTKAKMLSEGPPTEDLEGGWPEGWVKRVFERASGATKGSTDKYWYSPINGIKLRSIMEVRRFMKALEMKKGDEIEAKKIMKTIKL
ncbi:unnamed protein product [Cylindrotheca closterium]|uniref:MBD domain-containing protein n=1 Tax=Cylindrotheca closterium TaxID=2856 RepID=A0AAD2FX24_9STRA|nr:unnamed protein product [Cylindrotheca closterium]